MLSLKIGQKSPINFLSSRFLYLFNISIIVRSWPLLAILSLPIVFHLSLLSIRRVPCFVPSPPFTRLMFPLLHLKWRYIYLNPFNIGLVQYKRTLGCLHAGLIFLYSGMVFIIKILVENNLSVKVCLTLLTAIFQVLHLMVGFSSSGKDEILYLMPWTNFLV